MTKKLSTNYNLEDPQGHTDDEGNYVPTEQELRTRFPDIKEERDLSMDNYRMKVWRHPPTRNLIPFHTTEDAQAYQKNSAKSRSKRSQEYKTNKESKAMIMDIMRDELSADDDDLYDPERIIRMRIKMAMIEEDWEKVDDLSFKLLGFTKAKPATAAPVTTKEDIVGSANEQDMNDFLEGKLTYDEFMRKTKGE